MTDDVRTALADPITRARIDSLIADFRERGVAPLPLAVIAFATDCGLTSEAATLLAQAVQARLRAVDKYQIEVDWPEGAAMARLD